MGTRLNAFAVDMEVFGQVVEMPLWRLLQEMSKDQGSKIGFLQFPTEPYGVNYVREGRILRSAGGSVEEVAVDRLGANHFFQQRFKDYAARMPGGVVNFLLRDLPRMNSRMYVHLVTEGYRVGWMGSLLDAAEQVLHHTVWLSRLQVLFGKILQQKSRQSGGKVTEATPLPADFPVMPDPNQDFEMAYLSEAEFHELLQIFSILRDARATFEDPCLDTEEWTEFVYGRIAEFMRVPALGLKNLGIITFVA